ncbi:DEAD/DEAH box helicase [Aestuariibius sp. HNIBRBA575]|uniref:DEAD/DEAH box helicase n=1 Tax=Aestuariibius sp. HNIBRBA575 TaxID=3233343 RepID=UPI0034A4D73F
MNFEEMGLAPRLVAKLSEQGIVDPTPIQLKAIPQALEGRDVMGLAQTGTGKTAAFGLPMIEKLNRAGVKPSPKTARGLILAPTRELAKQISDNLRSYTDGSHLKVMLVVGGAGIVAQMKRLERGCDLLVATPGRLMDLQERGAVRLNETQFLVLDEADQMLDLGFIHALRKIATMLPEDRQTMLFSATMPKQMEELSKSYLRDPIKVQVNPPGKAADKIAQSVHFVVKGEKSSLLVKLIGEHREERAIVFGRTKHGCEKLFKFLESRGFAAASIHGNKSQGQRDRAIRAFKSGEIKVLVATDVAARGIDIPDVKHVYNYDLPNVAENYVHRIGRTARAGADGAAIAFCAPDEMGELKDIQKAMKADIPVASGNPWAFEDQPAKKPQRRGGRRPGGNKGGGFGGGKPRSQGGGGKPGGGKPGGGRPGNGRRSKPRRSAA